MYTHIHHLGSDKEDSEQINRDLSVLDCAGQKSDNLTNRICGVNYMFFTVEKKNNLLRKVIFYSKFVILSVFIHIYCNEWVKKNTNTM